MIKNHRVEISSSVMGVLGPVIDREGYGFGLLGRVVSFFWFMYARRCRVSCAKGDKSEAPDSCSSEMKTQVCDFDER